MNTLYWFLFRKYEFSELVNNPNDCACSFHKVGTEDYLYKCTSCNNKAYQLSRCPNCEELEILLDEAALDKNSYVWKCPHCGENIFLTDILCDITFVIEAGYILVSACLPAISWLLVTSRSAT